MILIESGSIDNLIATHLVDDLKLPVETIPSFGVQIGNGDLVRCNRICKNVGTQFLGLEIIQEHYPFPMVVADLDLGIKWLAMLNTY